MTIGEKIKTRRKELKLSQRELAAKMGYSHHSTLARIEAGKVDVSQTRIVQFADVLDTSIAYLMDWEEDEKKGQSTKDGELSANTKMLIDFVKSVPEDKVELVLRVMKSIVEDD